MNKDQRKLFKEREISDFVDTANEHDFDTTQTVTNHVTSIIEIFDKKNHCDVLKIRLINFMGNEVPEKPFALWQMKDYRDETDFDRLAWLFKRSNQLIDALRYNTKDVKPEVEDIHDEKDSK